MPEPFSVFLRRSLDAVRAEVPMAWRELSHQLDDVPILLRVDGDPTRLWFTRGELRWDEGTPVVEVRVGREGILAMIDGLPLADAVLDGHLDLRGAPHHLATFHDALLAWLHGAVRSPSHPALLRAYRSSSPRNSPCPPPLPASSSSAEASPD